MLQHITGEYHTTLWGTFLCKSSLKFQLIFLSLYSVRDRPKLFPISSDVSTIALEKPGVTDWFFAKQLTALSQQEGRGDNPSQRPTFLYASSSGVNLSHLLIIPVKGSWLFTYSAVPGWKTSRQENVVDRSNEIYNF